MAHDQAERAVANEKREIPSRQCEAVEFGMVRCTMEPDHKGHHRGMYRGVPIDWPQVGHGRS